jgi:hypothetical protein
MKIQFTHYLTILFALTIGACSGGEESTASADAKQAQSTSADTSADSVATSTAEQTASDAEESISLSLRKAINFDSDGQSISVPYNAMFDIWSDNKAYSWSVTVVKDSSDGSQFVPIIARGNSVYSVRIDRDNSQVEIKGEANASSHSATIDFSEALIQSTSDGTINLPLTITRSALGVEKWYFSTQLVKTFYNLPTSDTAQNQAIQFGSADGSPAEFRGELDMISLWNKELSLAEVTELISEYSPLTHSAYESSASNIWPLGEDIISSNSSGSVVYEIKNGLNASATNMSSDNFKLVDLSEFNALNVAEYPIITNTVLNATDVSALANATVKLISADATYTTTSDAGGNFSFSNTPMRSYTIEVSLEGFVTYATTFDSEATNTISLSPETIGADANDFRIVLTWNATSVDTNLALFINDGDNSSLATIYYANTSYSDGDFTVQMDREKNGY